MTVADQNRPTATSESAVYRSGQAWKFRFMVIGCLIGSVIMFGAEHYMDSLSAGWFPLTMLFGMAVIFTSLVYPAVSIQCPRCRAHWLWLAMSENDHRTWTQRLLQTNCPICNFPREAPKLERKRGNARTEPERTP